MGRQRNTTFELLLTSYGLSHQDLADEVNRVAADMFGTPGECTDRHVRRWIAGEVRWPWTRYLLPLQQIFGKPAQAMGFVPRGRSTRIPAPPPRPPAGRESEGIVQRRTFLAGALIAALGIDQAPQRGRLGASDVDRIERTITRLDSHFNGLGGGALIEVATDYLHRLHHALDHCSYGPRIEKALYRAISATASCAGWSAHDCGRYDDASRLRNEALQAALLAEDAVAQTRAWSDLAAQAEHAGRPAEAARINRAALSERHVRHTPLITTLLHARLADCLGATGDPSGMGRHLAAAERAYDRADTTTAPPSWLAFITPAEISGLAAIAHQSAGSYDRAELLTTQTIELLAPQFTRNRTYYTVLLAELQLVQGKHEQAALTVAGVEDSTSKGSRIARRLECVTAALDERPKGKP
ncbi:tetratricopeptide repeat protein [Streptomyces netropsis]